ncbi:MAG: hypothetical protein LIO59_03710 [Oscillospiraceae bacterium]|nr:hypothetical protein [Oscillospiraceae bacterium]
MLSAGLSVGSGADVSAGCGEAVSFEDPPDDAPLLLLELDDFVSDV